MTIVTHTLLWIGDSEKVSRDELFSGIIVCTSAWTFVSSEQKCIHVY